jgi:hypothetical protein
MAEEGLAVLETDIRVDELTVLEQADDLLHAARVSERAREQVAEAGGHGQERHGPARGGHRDGALGRVAPHRDQEREAARIRRRPALQVLETGEAVEPDIPALDGERLTETRRHGQGATVAGPRCDHNLDPPGSDAPPCPGGESRSRRHPQLSSHPGRCLVIIDSPSSDDGDRVVCAPPWRDVPEHGHDPRLDDLLGAVPSLVTARSARHLPRALSSPVGD